MVSYQTMTTTTAATMTEIDFGSRIRNNIKLARELDPRKLSQEAAAAAMGISRDKLAHWERVRGRRPSDPHLQMLADFYDRRVGWFLDEHTGEGTTA